MLEAENLRILSVYHHLSEAKTILKADVSKVNVALYTITAKEVVFLILPLFAFFNAGDISLNQRLAQ